MKTLSSAFLNNTIGKTMMARAQCIKIVLTNGTTLGFTSNTRPVTFIEEPNLVYKTNGFTPSAFSATSTFSISNLNIDLVIDNINIKRSDLEKNKFNGAYVEYFEIDWTIKPYSYANIDKIMSGNIGTIKRSESKFETEFNSKTSHYQQIFTRKLTATCMNEFGDAMCQVDLAPFTFIDTIASITTQRIFSLSTISQVDGYFVEGTLEVTSGAAVGEIIRVKDWVNSSKTVTMQLPFVEQLQVGDSIKIIRGCRNTKSDCITLFDNMLNFNAFPNLPGQDFLATGKGSGNVQ